jgi:hypothetical protein
MDYPTRYTGPYGPNPDKTRDERRAELMQLIVSVEGCEIIRNLRHAAEGVPKRIEPTSWRGVKMDRYIDAILRVEYPEASPSES